MLTSWSLRGGGADVARHEKDHRHADTSGVHRPLGARGRRDRGHCPTRAHPRDRGSRAWQPPTRDFRWPPADPADARRQSFSGPPRRRLRGRAGRAATRAVPMTTWPIPTACSRTNCGESCREGFAASSLSAEAVGMRKGQTRRDRRRHDSGIASRTRRAHERVRELERRQ